MNVKRSSYFLLALFSKMFLLFKLATTYLEPGSSSFLLKILISSLVGFVVFFRQIWSYVQAILNKATGKQSPIVEQNSDLVEQSPQDEVQ